MSKKMIRFFVFSLLVFNGLPGIRGEAYEVLGIGAPCIDILFQVEEDFLDRIQAKKGSCEHTDWMTFSKTFQCLDAVPTYVPGGSCSNTIKGLCHLGQKVAICGKMGKDEVGYKYLDHVISHGIASKIIQTDTPTQQVGVFITPDHQRTFRVFPGAAVEMTGADLDPLLFKGVKLVHIEGYALHNGDLVEKAIELAKGKGVKISLDLANFEVVKKHKERILDLLPHIDIVFANQDEAFALTGLSAEGSCELLSKTSKIAIILVGEQGCWVGADQMIFHSPALKANVIDTTGAGDLFASGFLYGYLKGKPLSECAYYGNLTGSSVVEVIGAEIPSRSWPEICKKMQQ